jgi:hypothetical protein
MDALKQKNMATELSSFDFELFIGVRIEKEYVTPGPARRTT